MYLVSFLIPPASQKLCNNLDGFLPPEIKLANGYTDSKTEIKANFSTPI